MPQITVPPFVIKELSGRKRTVKLTGRGLPYRPLTLDGEQRVKITNPAGNPDGYGTITGPTEGETKINGQWKDKYLFYAEGELPPVELTTDFDHGGQANTNGISRGSNSTGVSSAIDAIELVDSMRREGQLLEVSWGHVIRRGYIKSVSQTWTNIHDVEWAINFAWIGRSAPADIPSDFSPASGPLSTGSALRDALDRLSKILDTPGEVTGDFMSNIRNTLNRIAQFTDQIEQAAAGLSDQTSLFSPRGIGGTIGSLLGSVVMSADDLKEQFLSNGWAGIATRPLDQIPFSGFIRDATGTRDAGPPVYLDERETDPQKLIEAEQQAQEMLYQRESLQELRDIRNEALARRIPLVQGDTEVIGNYTARENDNLREVSNLYYGGPSHWREILVYNNLSSSQLVAGQVIVIPRLDVAREDL